MPVERDEWCRKCSKSGTICNFVSNDNIQSCPLCRGRHSLNSGCDVTVNLKKVCDKSSTVIRGIGELMGGIVKIQAELDKGKTSVQVKEKIDRVLTDGVTILVRLNKVMEPIKKKWKQHGHLMSKPKDSVDEKPKDSVDETPKDTTNVATKSKEEITRLAASGRV